MVLTPLSFDRKLTLTADTGADANAINNKTFDELSPDVELEESTFLLQNFEKWLVKPIGSFRCFLRWRDHKYKVRIEVMGIDTPNVLSRETTFLMGILKKCYPLEKIPIEQAQIQTNHIPISVSDQADQLSSIKVAFSHSVPSTLGVFLPFRSISGREYTLPFSSIHGREISDELCQHLWDCRISRNLYIWNSDSNNHSLSIADLPLTKEKVKSTYADVFQGLGKFPGDPYKLRLKPDAIPAKHRPRKVPVHLQEALHDKVQWLVKIDVLELVTEPTEWVNSFVVVEKVIDSSNAHSPNHSIKKSIRLCIDSKDLNEALEREPYYSRTIDELISMFAGAKMITIVDMDKGYWQVLLHPDLRKLEERATQSVANPDHTGCYKKAPLYAGQSVSVINNDRTLWLPATVIHAANHGSYLVKVSGGAEYRRAWDHICEHHPDAVRPDMHPRLK